MDHEHSRRSFISELLIRAASGCAFVAGLAGLSALSSGCGDAVKYGPLFDGPRPVPKYGDRSVDATKYGPLFDGPRPVPKYGDRSVDATLSPKYGINTD